MKKQHNPSVKAQIIRSAFILLVSIAIAAIPFALAQRNSGKRLQQPPSPAGVGKNAITGVTALPATLNGVSNTNRHSVTLIQFFDEHTIDLGRLGIQPTLFTLPSPSRPSPDSGAIGTFNAYMSVSADVVPPSTTAAAATILSGFTPSEMINIYVNGTLAGSFAANANGVLSLTASTPAGNGYFILEGIGQTSGKRAGGTFEALSTAPTSPGLAIAPHALAVNGTAPFYLNGTRYPASTAISIAVDGTFVATVTSNASGNFGATVAPAAGPDSSHVWTAYTATVGVEAGQSVEYRADAGTAPQSDLNLSRAFLDRPILPSGSGGTVAFVGEGFTPGESVTVSGCASGTLTATANGATSAFLTVGAGSGIANCVLTGNTSARVGRATLRADTVATNAPAGINAPATLHTNATNFIFLFDRLTPSENGTVYIDGVSQGTCSPCTNASGFGSVVIPPPNTIGPHAVLLAGASGDVAIAPLYQIPQSCNYTFTTGTGTFVSGTTAVGLNCDDCDVTVASL